MHGARAALSLCTLGGVAASKWLQTSATRVIRAPVGLTYDRWRDLPRMPQWSPVSRVDVDSTTGDSTWHLGYRGIEVSWQARVTTDQRPVLLRWESISGAPNRGEVRFIPEGDDACLMAFTMSYQIPSRISRLVESGVVQTFIVRLCLEPTMRQFCEAMEAEAAAARATLANEVINYI